MKRTEERLLLYMALIIIFCSSTIHAYSANTQSTLEITVTNPNPVNTPTLTLSNQLIDQGQLILFTASFSGGTSPFSYNYLIVNSITNAVITNMYFTGCTLATNTFLWTPLPNLYTSNTFKVNVIVIDTALLTANSIYYPIGYNSAQVTPTLALSPVGPISSGKQVTLTATASGGTTPYTYNFYQGTVSPTTQIGGCTLITTNSCTVTLYSVAGNTVYYFNVVAIDSPTTNTIANSITQSITVNKTTTTLIIPLFQQPIPNSTGNTIGAISLTIILMALGGYGSLIYFEKTKPKKKGKEEKA